MIENNYDLIANDALLPSQLTPSADTPDKRLRTAVLDDAVRIYLQGPSASHKQAQLYREAVEWLFVTSNDDHRFTFSMDSVCASLSIDAAWLREGLRKYEGQRTLARRAPVGRYTRRSPVMGRPRYMQAVREGRVTA